MTGLKMNNQSFQIWFLKLVVIGLPLVVAVGCNHVPQEEPLVVKQDATENYIPVMLDQHSFSFNGEPWMVTMDDIKNVVVHDTTENADGTYTADVSFESIHDEAGVAIDAKIQYKVVEITIKKDQKIATYPDVKVLSSTVKRIET